MRIQKTTSAIIEVNAEEFQALLNICEVIRRCTGDSFEKTAGDVMSCYDKNETAQVTMFVRSILGIDA